MLHGVMAAIRDDPMATANTHLVCQKGCYMGVQRPRMGVVAKRNIEAYACFARHAKAALRAFAVDERRNGSGLTMSATNVL